MKINLKTKFNIGQKVIFKNSRQDIRSTVMTIQIRIFNGGVTTYYEIIHNEQLVLVNEDFLREQ
jgi:hypothetical protein